MNSRIILYNCKKANVSWGLDRYYTASIGQFGEYYHLKNIKFPFMNMGCLSICFSLLYFNELFKFSVCNLYFFCQINFPVPYFFGTIVNGIVFLISFWDCLLTVYRITIDFWTLFLYPATLLNFFISSNHFYAVNSLRYHI